MSRSVPWVHSQRWDELTAQVLTLCEGLGENRVQAERIVKRMAKLYRELEAPLNSLCESSCVECTDPCCIKATVWYDLKDLLFIYLLHGEFPAGQVARYSSGACCHLSLEGCTLGRHMRPFICTWYLCAAQCQHERISDYFIPAIRQKIDELKTVRKELERICRLSQQSSFSSSL